MASSPAITFMTKRKLHKTKKGHGKAFWMLNMAMYYCCLLMFVKMIKELHKI